MASQMRGRARLVHTTAARLDASWIGLTVRIGRDTHTTIRDLDHVGTQVLIYGTDGPLPLITAGTSVEHDSLGGAL